MIKISGLLIGLCIVSMTFAQTTYDVTESEKAMYKGTHPALSMTFEGISVDAAAEEWKQFMKDYKGKTKEDKKGKVWFTDDAKMEKVSENTIDLYAGFAEVPGGAVVSVWFDLGGAYLSSNLDQNRTNEGKKVMQKYGHAISKRLAKEQWEMQEKHLSMLEKDLKKMENEQSDLQKKIDDLKEELMDLEAQAQQKLAEQQSQKNAMKAQEKVIEAAKALYKKH